MNTKSIIEAYNNAAETFTRDELDELIIDAEEAWAEYIAGNTSCLFCGKKECWNECMENKDER